MPTDLPQLCPPLGLSYIAAVLEENGYVVQILDALAEGIYQIRRTDDGMIHVGLGESDIKRGIKTFGPDVVGISCPYTSSATEAHKVARMVKDVCPDAYVLFGGADASVRSKTILKDKNVDIVVRGEGEMTCLEIVDRIRHGDDLTDIKGTTVRKKGEIVVNPPREFIQNLDALPFPARHLLPMDIYLKDPRFHLYSMRSPRTTIITSRGCPYNCVFCSIHSVWGRKWRARSAKNVVAEIELLVKKYGVKEIAIMDDNFTLNKERVLEICEEILDRSLDVKLTTPNGIAIWRLDKEMLTKMRGGGYYRATFGIESGCKETLKFIRKPVNLNHALEIIDHCLDLGLWVHSTFVIGFPYEYHESIKETVEFAKNSGIDFATFYIATPYPGTDLLKICKKENLIKERAGSYASVSIPAYDTKYFTRQELRELVNEIQIDFIKHRALGYLRLRNWVKLVRKLQSIDHIKYAIKIGQNVFRMILSKMIYGEVRYFPLLKSRSVSKDKEREKRSSRAGLEGF